MRAERIETRTARPAQPAPPDPRLHALTGLMALQRRMRWIGLPELRFAAVNEMRDLLPYRQAALWESPPGQLRRGRVTALSNVAVVERAMPFVLLVDRIVRAFDAAERLTTPSVLSVDDLPSVATGRTLDALQRDWRESLPRHLLWLPLRSRRGPSAGGLVLARNQGFAEGEIGLADAAADALAHALLHANARRSVLRAVTPSRAAMLLTAAVAVGSAVPVRMSVLAPAEVVADRPHLVRAPLEAVIDAVHVRSNERVSRGDLLVTFEASEMRARLRMAEAAVLRATSELRRAAQAGIGDPRANADVAAAEGRLREARLEARFLRGRLADTELRAPADGVAILDAANEWAGRPVAVGETILELADPSRTVLRAQLAARDRIALPDRAEVAFFSDAAPAAPAAARVERIGARAAATPEGTVAFRVTADWADPAGPDLAIGQRGTAKIHGETRPFAMQVLRRPLTLLRRWTGL